MNHDRSGCVEENFVIKAPPTFYIKNLYVYHIERSDLTQEVISLNFAFSVLKLILMTLFTHDKHFAHLSRAFLINYLLEHWR